MIIFEILKEKQTESLIQVMINSRNKIQLQEEQEIKPSYGVPDEIYDEKYKMIDIPYQSLNLIEGFERKIKNSFRYFET